MKKAFDQRLGVQYSKDNYLHFFFQMGSTPGGGGCGG